MDNREDLQNQFAGYSKTPLLWDDDLMGLKQFHTEIIDNSVFDSIISKRFRLGHLVEHFVQFGFINQDGIEVLAKNVQVISEKQTLGEFDFLIEQDGIPYQIEVVFKFYLYDESVGTTEIEHWIGPNRNDSLIQKIDKIKEKQFPLIKKPEAKKVLESYGLNSEAIEQRVYFKGKLFVPYGKEVDVQLLNPSCIAGYYISIERIKEFSDFEIYVPSKHDWLVEAHDDVSWLKFEEVVTEISRMIEEKRSPLIWLKDGRGEIEVAFVVWWGGPKLNLYL